MIFQKLFYLFKKTLSFADARHTMPLKNKKDKTVMARFSAENGDGKAVYMKNGKRAFFAAANTEEGFRNLFGSVFSPHSLKKIFIIKGGPGTGKSTLMKHIAAKAEEKGYEAELYYCSSDTQSLDGVIIPALSCAVLDGTAPHATDPKYPAAAETVVSLYDAFNMTGLRARRDEIIATAAENSEYYRAAYRFLSAAGKVSRETEEWALSAYDFAKAAAAQKRLIRAVTLPRGFACESEEKYVDAIGTSGEVHLTTLEDCAKKVYTVSEKYGLGGYFLTELGKMCADAGMPLIKCPSPLRRDRLESLYIKGADVLFTVCRDEEKCRYGEHNINILRFADKNALSAMRRKLKFSRKCFECLMDAANENLAQVKRVHAALEAIYIENTDFSAVEDVRDKILRDIFADNM